MSVRRVVWSFIAAIAITSILLPNAAEACLNAVMSLNESIAKLKEAETALDEGDVQRARGIAWEMSFTQVRGHDMFDEQAQRLHERALGIAALSYIRDPSASTEDLEHGLHLLDSRYTSGLTDNPANAADYGEALERLGKNKEAVALLAPLADRDLIGSAYAYGALSRAAAREGDPAKSQLALQRCQTMATSAKVCRGEYPRPPLLKAKPLHYFVGALPFLLFAIIRFVRARRRIDRLGREKPSVLWSTYGAKPIAALTIASGALVVLAAPPSPWTALLVALVTLFMIATLQRRLFLRAVRLGKIADLKARVLDLNVDDGIPIVRMFFGPSTPLAVERVSSTDPGYRENAHNPVVLGMSRRMVPTGLVVAAIGVSILLLGCASMMMLSRG